MDNILNAYPTINEDLKKTINCEIHIVRAYSKINDIEKNIQVNINSEDEFYLEDSDGIWNPKDYNLNIQFVITLENKNILFDEQFGIVGNEDSIGIALVWFCKDTNQLKTIPVGEIIDDENNYAKFDYNLAIDKGFVKNKINYKLLFYLKKQISNNSNQNEGCILGSLGDNLINIEGDGSVFPIELIQDKSGLLWSARFNYSDIYEDEFNKSHLCLFLNKAHKDYSNINIDEDNISPLLKEILANFIFLFMCDLKDNNVDFNDIVNMEINEDEGCIANIVKIWIDEFNIDFSSNSNMFESIRKSMNRL